MNRQLLIIQRHLQEKFPAARAAGMPVRDTEGVPERVLTEKEEAVLEKE